MERRVPSTSRSNAEILIVSEEEDPTYFFFLLDTRVRLRRSCEYATALCLFTFLLYVQTSWHLLADGQGSYFAVFLPLFFLDWRNILHVRYIKNHRANFAPWDSVRFLILTIAEICFKLLMCCRLTWLHSLQYKVIMFPYVTLYVIHFALGRFTVTESLELPEGCNVVGSLLSELLSFILFVEIILVSLKEDDAYPQQTFPSWREVFWPCWALDFIAIMVTSLLAPILAMSFLVNRSQVMMLTWIFLTGLGFSIALSISSISLLHSLKSGATRQQTRQTLIPWMLFFPCFAVGTWLFRSKLAKRLHDAWYQLPRNGAQSFLVLSESVRPPVLWPMPPPKVMFRVTSTYYTRTFDALYSGAAAPANVSFQGQQGRATPRQHHESSVRSTPLVGDLIGSWLDRRRGGSYVGSAVGSRRRRRNDSHELSGTGLPRVSSGASRGSCTISNNSEYTFDSLRSRDPGSSILEASVQERVGGDNICFICYDEKPEAVLLECGHAGMCVGCAKELRLRQQGLCPICRAQIHSVVRLCPHLPVRCFSHMRPISFDTGTAGSVCAPAYGSSDLFGVRETSSSPPRWPYLAARSVVSVTPVKYSDERVAYEV
jgi:hypothetical protein